MKLPSRKSRTYNIIIVGTRLHHDSLTSRVAKRKDFKTFNFPLVLQFPTNLTEIDKNTLKPSDIKGMILDDNSLDKYELLLEYFEDKDSFYSEFQNQPLSADNAIFNKYRTYNTPMPKCDMYSIALDPSMGKQTGDYFAIAVLGYKDDDKRFYAKVDGYKISPINLIPKIIKLYLKYDSISRTIMSVETVAYQEFFKDALKKEASKLGIFLNIKEYRNTVSKELRLMSLAPLVQDETILIDENDDLLIEELMTYPKAAHVDLLDALEMANRNFKNNGRIDYGIVKKVFRQKRALGLRKYG
jgi:predicted phage terminase large subunit-like protein